MSRLVCPANPDFHIPALYVHDLTGTADAERLLQTTPPVHPTSDIVLPRLQAWAPEVAKLFTPVKSKKKDIPFRLITQSPTWDADRTRDFVAVSYCWHSDDWDLAAPLQRDESKTGTRLPITARMLGGVISNCLTPDTAIWIDQICIEQTNVTEKKHAIEQMDTIYRNASTTFILLEDVVLSEQWNQVLLDLKFGPASTETRQNAYSTRTERQDAVVINLEDFEPTSKNYIDRLQKLDPYAFAGCVDAVFKARWFHRAWCKQEYLLSTDRVFLFPGPDQELFLIGWDFFGLMGPATNDVVPKVLISAFAGSHTYRDYFYSFGIRTSGELLTGPPFESFCKVRASDCSITADKVAIAMNIVGLPFGFNTAHIDTTITVEFILSALALAMGDASVLGLGSAHLRPNDAQSLYRVWHTQSAMPGIIKHFYNHRWSDRALEEMPKIQKDHHISAVGTDSIGLGMFLLEGRPEILPSASMKRAFRCLKALESTGMRFPQQLSSEMNELEQLICGGDYYIDALRDRSIALRASLSCLAFAVMLGSQWTTVVAGLEPHEYYTPEIPSDAALTALRALASVTDASSALEDYRRQICVLFHFVLNTVLYVPGSHTWTATTVRLGQGDADHALLFLPEDMTTEVLGRSTDITIAVPAALSTSEAVAVQRVWLLRDTSNLHMKSCFAKGYLFGCGRIAESAGYVEFVDKLEVVGPSLTNDDERWIADGQGYDIQSSLHDCTP